ncbi:SET domain protein [Aspergillus saccharolyticus JOP 1030-1]|uniref:SET domain-containing protein n=1 Tax=Aspergillus saccharolyticus JOP 1030-1 TaxID=1450539 RepID=A0A319AEI9_9EURO|nr:SET domain-containing protein [Aspergillus saccharolyticus JOP 1030-1]PYH45272.1 SET domain-containing protein [Aspergillus saccharolyticus JOP 1030-1]
MAASTTARSSSTNDDTSGLEMYADLQTWLTQHGGHLHQAVQVARDKQRGVHLQVRKDWSEGPGLTVDTHIIQTPLTTTISYFNVIGYRAPLPAAAATATGAASEIEFKSHGLDFPRTFIDAVGSKEATVFFLVGQYLRGAQSFWYPYLRTLPQPGTLTTPPNYEGEDLRWLQGTSLWAATEQRVEKLRGQYEVAVRALREAGFEGVDGYTWDLYLWASTIFFSRAFSAKVLSGVIPNEELSEEKISVLLPFFDVANHRPLAKVEWRAEKDEVRFVVLENVRAGEEISNNYGPRHNEQLMMNYGFCLPDNPCDYRVVSLRAPPGSPLQQARSHQLQMFPELAAETEDHYYVFNIFYPLLAPDSAMEHSIFSPALLNAVSVLAANNRELETLEITDQAIKLADGYGSSRALLAAMSQIVIELITHAVKLRTSGQDLQNPKNLKQIHAKMYRDSQIMLSETALVIAAWTLNRARQHGFTGSWEETKKILGAHMARIPAGKFPEGILSRLQMRILERKSLLTQNGELFTLTELPDLLPAEMQQPSQACIQEVLSTAENAIPALRGSSDTSPFAYPVFLCLIAVAYAGTKVSGSSEAQLSPRLTRWASFLLENYPPPPNDVAWALEDEDDEYLVSQFDEALEDLRARSSDGFAGLEAYTGAWQKDDWWLSPNWIRWAWMVAEQECVLMPENALDLLASEGQVMLSTESYLYIPQSQ